MNEVKTYNPIWGDHIPNKVIAKEEYSFYLKQMRKATGLSSQDIAQRLGISQSSYSNYERGASIPKQLFAFHTNFKRVIQQELYQQRMSSCK